MTLPFKLTVKFDVFASDPALSVPGNISVFVQQNVAKPVLPAVESGPDYIMLFSPVANALCSWKPF
jgi:hypothetical protein